MKVQLNTNVVDSIVPDTYGSEFCYDIMDDCWEDFKEEMVNIGVQYIKDLLSETDFADATITNTYMSSPREYNFETDAIEFTLEFDDSKIDEIAKFIDDDVQDERKFVDWLAEHYKSYSGFTCTMPDSYEKFMSCLNGRHSEYYQWRAIAAYISYQIQDVMDLDKVQEDYMNDVREYASQNGMWVSDYEEEGVI